MDNDFNDAQIATIMDSVVDGFIIIDELGKIESFNKAAVKIFGYSPDEVLGNNVKMLMPDPYYSEHDTYLSNYRETNQKKIIGIGREITAQRKDGSTFPMELSVSEMLFNNKRFFLGTIKDISERKQYEASIQSYLNHVETMMDTVLDGLITIDEKGVVGSFNRAAESIFGYQGSEVIGNNVKMLMPDPYHSEHDGYLTHFLATGEKKVIGKVREIVAQKKDGSVFSMELGVNEMSVEGKRMFVGTIKDITERKESEKSIESFIRKLQLSNQELDQFAYIASHDLKEPLRGLANNALFLQEDFEGQLGEAGNRRLNRMRFLCGRMEQLVDSLLYYSRLGRQELAIENIDLETLLNSVFELTLPDKSEQHVEIIIPSKLPTITCDVPRTKELFRNLISNAIKYNNNKYKTIEIGVVAKDNQSSGQHENQVFYVKDNGIGIHPQFFEDIFRIFKRLNEEDDNYRGTGVGLTFVKKIVERQGGQIWVESEPGKGTCFYFTINIESESNDE